MKDNQRFLDLLDALRAVLHQDVPSHQVGFEQLLGEAEKQAVSGMLYDVPGIAFSPDAALRLQRVSSLMALEKHNKWMDGQVAGLAHKLDQESVRFAVMKGQTCAAFYPNPLHRISGDIDVYVVPCDFERANGLLLQWGCKLIDKTMLHSTYQIGKLEIEVHFAIQKLQYIPYYNRLRKMTTMEFDSSSSDDVFIHIGNYDVRVLPDELNLVLLTTHAFNHVITAGLGLRQVIDWQMVLSQKAERLDWEKLMRFLDELHLRKWFLVLAYVNVNYLGMDGSIFIQRGLDFNHRGIRCMAERLLSWMEVCGNFGKSMDLGTGKMYFVRYYSLFLYNLVRFFPLNPMEMLAWPWMKLYRGITHRNHL